MTGMKQEKKAIGVYIHIPFCRKKCYYCDFYSLPDTDESLLDQYCQALVTEIETAAWRDELMVSTIFLGGGTPSLLSARQLSGILQQIAAVFPVSSEVEITVEANPATINLPKMEEYLTAGVNRISLGAQSFADDELTVLGRVHNAEDILSSVQILYKCGLENFNLDLIYGIPGQSIRSWETNLRKAMELKPAHISAYLLQLAPQTIMARQAEQKLLTLADEETEAAMYEVTIDELTAGGFKQYEISNFSLPDYECRHNIFYWQSKNYLGFGAGAVSYMDNRRYINKPELFNYMESLRSGKLPPTEELENMSLKEQLADAIVLGLRLSQGINIEEINKRFDIDFIKEYSYEIKNNIEKGLLNLNNGQLALTRRGYFLSNEVLCHFVA
ncbi:MAG TPA: radical SAM family heme chaperone HemW [Syntrophomonadaceae bacterium]|nr:radical SAM family heme chaperone HemW [Syntrophomonadaceae bacterium]HPR92573.1 radical SAM family heme chaperone HemW [Syntrophomonadaceae bacterium]